ncbi:ATP-binding protein [Bordetella sp. BOR01]|uniref:sensor histidine kinase n=1 Tax=Bordetella sp. BOR01 TaxID=2854779 RepID=UPI001C48BAED|nr:ATP-binding protein [Bordetella sp. BOR01]MBV7482387.1 sensor histidine kinase N-terminal domain-containing protein [Bordetella sp. BOR01]
MPSLKRRLLWGLLLALVVNWASWFTWFAYEQGRTQTGVWDQKLHEVANVAMRSLPLSLTQAQGPIGFEPADGSNELFETQINFQIWTRDGSRQLARSPGAPATPLSDRFENGYADVTVDGQPWRMYAATDVDNQIQIQVGIALADRRAEFRAWLWQGLKASALLFLLLTLTLRFVVNRTLARLDGLRAALLSRDPFDLAPLPHDGMPAELQPLIVSVNRLLTRLGTAMNRERRFIADAAHELRTPLAALTTHAELARAASENTSRQVALDRLLAVARRATRLSEQLLDQARLDAIEQRPATPVDLAALVSMGVRDYESAARNKRQHIMLDTQACTVNGDIDAIGILVSNLMDNAVRYTPEGGRIEVHCAPLPGGGAVLSVADDGPGVPQAEWPRIFDRFYRASGNNRTRGSGIGLSLVAQIARLHGGKVECAAGLGGHGLCVTVVMA